MRTIERIYEYINKFDLSLREFESKAKIGNGYLAKIKSGTGDVGHKNIIKICSTYRDINYEWLAGIVESPMLISDSSKKSTHLVPIEMLLDAKDDIIKEKDARIKQLTEQFESERQLRKDCNMQLMEMKKAGKKEYAHDKNCK